MKSYMEIFISKCCAWMILSENDQQAKQANWFDILQMSSDLLLKSNLNLKTRHYFDDIGVLLSKEKENKMTTYSMMYNKRGGEPASIKLNTAGLVGWNEGEIVFILYGYSMCVVYRCAWLRITSTYTYRRLYMDAFRIWFSSGVSPLYLCFIKFTEPIMSDICRRVLPRYNQCDALPPLPSSLYGFKFLK